MRDILVFAFVMLSLPTCFRRPFYGLLVFSWLAYMRPQDLCWGFARTMRLSFLVGFAMVAGWWAIERGSRRFANWSDFRSKLIVLLGLLISISYAFASIQDSYTNTYFFEFIKILAIALFTTGQVNSKERFKILAWTIAACLAFFGVKGGLLGVLRGGGHIIRGPGGMMEDNNDFALALVMNVPLLWYLGMAEHGRAWVLKATRIAVVLTVITIILTHSRGAFLALTATALWIAWRSGRLVRAFAALTMLGLIFPFVVPQSVLDRLSTISTEESSAAARLKSWGTAFNMIEDNPVWGVGMRNFQPRYVEYLSYPVYEGQTFVAHNSYLQIWAESGTLAFIVYGLLLASVFLTCRRVYRIGRSRPDLGWCADYARMMEATTVGFMVGAFFLNRGHFDLIYHWFALVAGLAAVSHVAYRTDPSLSMTAAPGGAKNRSISVRRRPSFGSLGTAAAGFAQALPRWQRRT